jgi:integrase
MGLYFSLNLHKPKKDYFKDEEVSVVINYYFNGKKIRVASSIKVKIKDWGDSQNSLILKSDSDYKSKNILLKSKKAEIERIIHKIIINRQNPEVSLVKQHLNRNVNKRTTNTKRDMPYNVLLDDYIKILNEDVALSKNYKRSVINSLHQIIYFITERFNDFDFLVSNFDEDFQNDYKNYSVGVHNRTNSTIQKHLKHLSSFMRWCLKNKFIDYPFDRIKMPINNDREVIYLQRDEIEKLFHFKDFDYSSPNHLLYTKELMTDKLKNGSVTTYTNLEVYKDMLLFGCGVGCRFGDLINLKLDNYEFSKNDRKKGNFIFRMEKTHKRVKVPNNSLTYSLWVKYSKNKTKEDYIFPRTRFGNPISNQKMNENLKLIGKIVGLNRLVSKPIFNSDNSVRNGTDIRQPLYHFVTTHIIRRTFIREALNSGLPRHLIMEMSGHSTEREFGKYFSVIETEREAISSLFSYDLNQISEFKEPISIPTLEEENTNPKASKDLDEKLINLKRLFDNGLIPEDVYKQQITQLLAIIS